MFSMCCAREEDVDLAALRRERALGNVVRRPVAYRPLDDDDGREGTGAQDGYASTDSESVDNEEGSALLSRTESTQERMAKRLSAALCLVDDDGNRVTPLDSLEQAKGVLESFSDPALQGDLAALLQNFLFAQGRQELYVSSCSKGVVALGASDEAHDAEVVYKLSGKHEYLAGDRANELTLEQELCGMLKVQEFFKFVRNINEIASSSTEPVDEEDLMDALRGLLPKLSALMGDLTEPGSGDVWIDRDEEHGVVHVRIEAVLDVNKIAASPYASVAETLKRAHSLDLRTMKLPPGCSGLDKAALRERVKGRALNDFATGIMLKVLSTRHAGAGAAHESTARGAKRTGKSKHNCVLRLDFCIEGDGHDLVWMDPRTCLAHLEPSTGRYVKVNFDEDLSHFQGRCLLGFELTAGVSELGCATISLPKVIACVDYAAEEAVDGVAATIECYPLHIDWNRLIKMMARPLIDLGRMEKLLMSDFSFKVRIGPPESTLESAIERHGCVPGFGHFPDLPSQLDPWTMRASFRAKLVRPASVVLAFVRMYVSSQVDDFGELTLWRDLTVAFVSDLNAICAR